MGDRITDLDTKMHAEINKSQEDRHSRNILQWLAPPDPSTNFNKAIKARNKGSGQKLLDDRAYLKWKSGGNPLLWLHGIPGCGKTILLTTVIEDLQASKTHTHAHLYFYFDFSNTEKQSFDKCIRSLAHQLYNRNETTRENLDELYRVSYNGSTQPTSDALLSAFAKALKDTGDVWIVLDALDECTSRTELLPWIRSLVQGTEHHGHIYFLATSRPEQDIKAAFESFAEKEQTIAITNDLLEVDIRNYVHMRVREEGELQRWQHRPDILSKVETTLLVKTKGM